VSSPSQALSPAALPSVPGQRTTPGTDGAAQAPPGLSLWLLNVVEETDAATALAPRLLDEAEQKRAAAFYRDKDSRSYTSAHVALRLLLGERLQMPPEAVRFVRETCPTCGEPHGRPAVAGGGLHFSLSHSGALALIGTAPVTVGVDVEETPTLKVATDTARMLHADETAELDALAGDARAEGFGRVWTRKEAYLKALGTGLSRSPALDYMGTGPVPAQDLPGWALWDVQAPQGYVAAVALRDEKR
jgi:4'-phosphopantetheinyl transferase